MFVRIGVDLGGSHIGIGVVDNNGKIIEKVEKRIIKSEKKNIKRVIEDYIVSNVLEFLKRYKITGIGIAIPGTVKDDVVVKSVNLDLKNYYIVKRIREGLKIDMDLPISVKNDTKCAALAENVFGALREYDRGLFIALGTGIGGAVIIDNKLLDTGELPGCEFGHMIIQKNGIKCNCGKKGCFEKYASMKAFKDNLREVLNLDEKTSGKELLNIIRKTKKGDINYYKINQVVNEYIENLSIGISNLINIFEPEVIVIGGSFSYYEEVFMDKLKYSLLENNLLFNERKDIIINTAILNNDAGIIGASLI